MLTRIIRVRAGWDLERTPKAVVEPAKLIFALSHMRTMGKREFGIMLFVKICVYALECTQGFKRIGIWDSMVTAWAQSCQPLKSSSPGTF